VLAGSVLWNVIGHVNTLDMGVSFFLAAAVFALCLAQRDQPAPLKVGAGWTAPGRCWRWRCSPRA
jgi:4-amino-4-deoxy-L-arabinose transferase-like glycosyltransferase